MKDKRRYGIVTAIFLLFCSLYMCKMPVEAATSSQKEAFRAELEDMLYSADVSSHNVYQYKLTVSEFENLYEEMENGDCKLIIASYYSNMYVSYTKKLFWVDSIRLVNVDSDVLPRYERLKKNVESIMSGIEEGMTELDKVIYLHDEIVDLTSYKYVAYQSYGACGVLGDKTAVCAGYTKAYNLLLGMEGIETCFVDGEGIDHGWTYVNIDGSWYHIDTTWDDTRSFEKGKPSHQFLLRNDAEFCAEGPNSHVGWKTYELPTSSKSTRFIDWYVHDITGKMAYENGKWYYVDEVNNDIMCADALGQEVELVLEGTNVDKLTLVDVENGRIIYKIGSRTVTEMLDSVGMVDDSKENDVLEIPDVIPDCVGNVAPGSNMVVNPNDVSVYDFNDIAIWREGRYDDKDGEYTTAAGYICTKEIVSCKVGSVLQIAMKDSRFHAVISEYTSQGTFLQTTDVVNGSQLKVSDNCAYVGVSIYFPAWSTITFSEYKTKFTYGLMSFEVQVEKTETKTEMDEPKTEVVDPVVKEPETEIVEPEVEEPETGIVEPEVEEPETETVEPEVEMPTVEDVESESGNEIVIPMITNIATYNYNDINNWQEGRYSASTGEYEAAAGYISSKEWVSCLGDMKLQIGMKDARFHAVINEYTGQGEFLKSTDVVDGNRLTISDGCSYIGVSIYFPYWSAISFSEYTTKFTYDLMSFEFVRVE